MTDTYFEDATHETDLTGNEAIGATSDPSGSPSDVYTTPADIAAYTMSVNGKISPTVTSNNLTVALKTLSGTYPSASDPVKFNINGTIRTVTSALSVTCNAATNWMNLGAAEHATNENDIFAYIGYNATDGVVLGISRIPCAGQYSNFSTTSTDETYARISTITTAASTDPYFVIGRFAATLSAGAGYTWTVPTYTPSNLIQHPVYETRWLVCDPVITGNSPLVVDSYAVNTCLYKLDSTSCIYLARVDTIDTSGTADNTLFANYPISPTDIFMPGAGQYADGGSQLLMQVYVLNSTNLRFRKYDNSNWDNAAEDIRLFWSVEYPIQS